MTTPQSRLADGPFSTRPVVVVGPTGAGKSALALGLAQSLGGEIVSCDSVQVYKGFDVGSAKATDGERALVPHHLLDVCRWDEDFDAAAYGRMGCAAIAAIQERGRVPIVVGGTGLYLRALLQERFHDDLPKDEALRATLGHRPLAELYQELLHRDPERATELHPNDRCRVMRALELNILLGCSFRAACRQRESTVASRFDGPPTILVLEPPRDALHRKIATRTQKMLDDGLVDEVQRLFAAGASPDCKPMRSIGYQQVAALLMGRAAAATLPALIEAATRQYAKRQGTWFRRLQGVRRLSAWETGGVLDILSEMRH